LGDIKPDSGITKQKYIVKNSPSGSTVIYSQAQPSEPAYGRETRLQKRGNSEHLHRTVRV